jgi:tetratricopeptide (TPR) repeat protein
VWQALREEMKNKGFEVITVACESKGAAAAEPFLKAANPQHPSLLDERHIVPELYNTRNVPAAFWIDEEGRIVRANDPIYATRRNQQTGETTTNTKYLDALRDWVANGPRSQYVQDTTKVREKAPAQTPEGALALAHFRLGVYIHQQGHAQDAIAHFKEAHRLQPENWNYRRQAFNLGNPEQDYGTTLQKLRQDPATPPFYPPLEIQ